MVTSIFEDVDPSFRKRNREREQEARSSAQLNLDARTKRTELFQKRKKQFVSGSRQALNIVSPGIKRLTRKIDLQTPKVSRRAKRGLFDAEAFKQRG